MLRLFGEQHFLLRAVRTAMHHLRVRTEYGGSCWQDRDHDRTNEKVDRTRVAAAGRADRFRRPCDLAAERPLAGHVAVPDLSTCAVGSIPRQRKVPSAAPDQERDCVGWCRDARGGTSTDERSSPPVEVGLDVMYDHTAGGIVGADRLSVALQFGMGIPQPPAGQGDGVITLTWIEVAPVGLDPSPVGGVAEVYEAAASSSDSPRQDRRAPSRSHHAVREVCDAPLRNGRARAATGTRRPCAPEVGADLSVAGLRRPVIADRETEQPRGTALPQAEPLAIPAHHLRIGGE
jgi:hypothetical protein